MLCLVGGWVWLGWVGLNWLPCLCVCFVCFACLLACLLACWMAGWLAGWLAGLFVFLFVCLFVSSFLCLCGFVCLVVELFVCLHATDAGFRRVLFEARCATTFCSCAIAGTCSSPSLASHLHFTRLRHGGLGFAHGPGAQVPVPKFLR